MSYLHFPRQHRSGVLYASPGRLSFAGLLTLTLLSATTGAIAALVAQRLMQRRQMIELLPSSAPIHHLQGRAATPTTSQPSPTPQSSESSLGAVADTLTSNRTAELEEPVAEDSDVVAGDGTMSCPADFPIKGNGRSGIYHWPGSHNYKQTHPTLCFRTTDAADRAGFRPANR